jgi:hypothetical protein
MMASESELAEWSEAYKSHTFRKMFMGYHIMPPSHLIGKPMIELVRWVKQEADRIDRVHERRERIVPLKLAYLRREDALNDWRMQRAREDLHDEMNRNGESDRSFVIEGNMEGLSDHQVYVRRELKETLRKSMRRQRPLFRWPHDTEYPLDRACIVTPWSVRLGRSIYIGANE